MSLSYQNRIALHYMLATALLMAIVFGAIYFIVEKTVISKLDSDLAYEAAKHSKEIVIIGDSIVFKNKAEWEEREHREIQVYPVFIQLIDTQGDVMDKSPNLKEDRLPFDPSKFGGHFNAQLKSRAVRQVQLPIRQGEEVKGYILAAVSSESAHQVILRLRNVMMVSYLIVLGGLYFVSRFLAGRSIKPIQEVTHTISRIIKNNLKERVTLPSHKDEIYELSTSFNALMGWIEEAIERERQFTSDASHELRTPISTLRGTLEVLLRKPRTQNEYEAKIKIGLATIDRMTYTLEQLLLLARLDSHTKTQNPTLVSLATIVDDTLSSFRDSIKSKNLSIKFSLDTKKEWLVPSYYTHLIINNLLSNAIKYSKINGKIHLCVDELDDKIHFKIQDKGIGIKKEDLNHIYKNFFRSGALLHKEISGNGLGLSIVKKSIEAIRASIYIESELDVGTSVSVLFKKS